MRVVIAFNFDLLEISFLPIPTAAVFYVNLR